jgi:hypothetical protein
MSSASQKEQSGTRLWCIDYSNRVLDIYGEKSLFFMMDIFSKTYDQIFFDFCQKAIYHKDYLVF